MGGKVQYEPLVLRPEWLWRLIGDKYYVGNVTVIILDSNVSDASLAAIEVLHDVKRLKLINVQITDANLEHLERLINLETLAIDNTLITDAGLEHLANLSNLRRATLRNKQVTDEGVKKLQQALPKCTIYH